MPGRLSSGTVALAIALGTGVAAAQAPAAPAAARACITCHGANGLSVTPDAPNLAGQPQIYLAAQLRAYRGGQRPHEVMGVIAKTLSDDDIAALAAWYSAIRIEIAK